MAPIIERNNRVAGGVNRSLLNVGRALSALTSNLYALIACPKLLCMVSSLDAADWVSLSIAILKMEERKEKRKEEFNDDV